MNVILVGTGAVAAELTSYIDDNNKFLGENQQLNIVGYLEFEENIEKFWRKYSLSKPVLSDVFSYQFNEGDHFIIAVSNLEFRLKLISAIKEKGGKVINFIHHSTIMPETTILGEGNIIYPYCIIGPNCRIGDFNLITSYSCISHDCIIGENNFFSTAVLGGRVEVGNHNFFGIRSAVIPSILIGNQNTIQAGMVVDKHIENGATVFHRFKEKVIAIPKQEKE